MARLASCHTPGVLEAGCDEAGRGCLAGPVVAAAVILPPRLHLPGLDDSKKLTHNGRERLRPLIEQGALAWGIGMATVEEIDRINILNASFLAMHRAIANLHLRPEALLVDGNRFRAYEGIPHHCIIQGDGKFRSIAAASVLAKTHRDELMAALHNAHPAYGWQVNKGYPTADHRAAIAAHGPCAHHRTSFTLLPVVE
ncbi:MAG TPA: ribonuclease HII [Flavobacteriales bacterium]|nr:ribonuclease HII [Flavobacteriales bacterium]HRO40705.1 ribonuclease HII [Flavobacteriales bacterium]HRP82762.1 ribonuclease HII [Flavobacteriales bacterium]